MARHRDRRTVGLGFVVSPLWGWLPKEKTVPAFTQADGLGWGESAFRACVARPYRAQGKMEASS